MFFSICLGKKNAEVIKFLGILKKYVSKNKIYFCSRKKSNVSLNKKVIFVFHTIFKLDFITQIIYCIIHRCLSSHFIFFLGSRTIAPEENCRQTPKLTLSQTLTVSRGQLFSGQLSGCLSTLRLTLTLIQTPTLTG